MPKTVVELMRFEKFKRVLILNKPDWFTMFDKIKFDTRVKGKYDLIISFVFSLPEMKKSLKAIKKDKLLNYNGQIYVVYPKKTNKKYETFIPRDDVLPYLGFDKDGYMKGTNFKFNRMLSYDETFTAIGLVFHETRKPKQVKKDKELVDYDIAVPNLRKAIDHDKVAAEFFDNLAPGYQRQWARYVYSAKTEETIAKRVDNVVDILEQGYKSMREYIASK